MSKLSLKAQLLIAVSIAMTAYLTNVGIRIYDVYGDLKKARQAAGDVQFLESLSKAMHQLQLERGRSAGFLEGATTADTVNEQRAKTDEVVSEFRKTFTLASLPKNNLDEGFGALDAILALRTKIDSKQTSGEEAVGTFFIYFV